MIPISTLKELSLKTDITNLEQRMLIMYYIFYNSGMLIKECIIATINDKALFEKNLNISKDYFKSFVTDEIPA